MSEFLAVKDFDKFETQIHNDPADLGRVELTTILLMSNSKVKNKINKVCKSNA